MNLNSERSLNRWIIPITKKSRKKLSFPIEINFHNTNENLNSLIKTKKEERYFKCTDYWDERTFMLTDLLTTKIAKTIFGNYIPNTIREDIINELSRTRKGIEKLLNTEKEIFAYLSMKDIRSLPKFNTMNYNNIWSNIQRLVNCKFSFNYEFRYYDQYSMKFLHDSYPISEQSLISNFKEDKNGFKLYLNNKLSKLYISNISQLNLDLIPTGLYKLSIQTQLFYRSTILSSRPNNNKNKKTINLSQFRKLLNISSDCYNTKRIFKNCLNELLNNSFINDYNLSDHKNVLESNIYATIHIKPEKEIKKFEEINVP